MARSVQELEAKAQLDAADRSTILKLRETVIKKSKINGDSNRGKPGSQISAIMSWIVNVMYRLFQLTT